MTQARSVDIRDLVHRPPGATAAHRAGAVDTYVMPARLPRLTVAQFGLPVDPRRVGEAVDTELLVRADGTVLALRFVH